jgi:hypothetical protein
MPNNTTVTASELGEYVFCKRGWWLKRHGQSPTTQRMMEGTNEHQSLANRLISLDKKLLIAISIIGIGCIFALIAAIFTIP